MHFIDLGHLNRSPFDYNYLYQGGLITSGRGPFSGAVLNTKGLTLLISI